MSLHARGLTAEDASAYRRLRLEALQTRPDAFGSSFEEHAHLGVDHFAKRLAETAYFGVFDADTLVGSAGLACDTSIKSGHIGNLIGVYLQPAYRGRGAAKLLIATALAFAQTRVKQVHLGVGTHNEAAIRLYTALGFERYGTEPRSLYVDGRYIDEHLMVLFLDKAPDKDRE